MKRLFAAALFSCMLFAQEHATEGNPKSAVRVVAYEDLECSDCAAYRRMMDNYLLPKYGKTVAFEHRDMPLAKHKWARPAALAARYFDKTNPGLGVDWRKYALRNQSVITAENFRVKLGEFAKPRGIDAALLDAALQDKQINAAVERDLAEAVARGVSRTPTVLVNGEPFIETFTFEQISKAIDLALQTASAHK